MNIITLLCISLFGCIGVVYIYSGKTTDNRLLLWCGIALTILPLILSRLFLIVVVETVLVAAPALVPKAVSWFSERRKR